MGQFSFDANAGETPQSLEAKRTIANAMLKQGMDTSPIVSPFQGLARIAEALSGSYTNFHANKDEAGYKNTAINNANSALSPIVQSLLGGGQPPAAPGPQVSGAAPPPSLMEDVMAKAPAYPGGDGITAADQGGVFKPTLPPTQVASAQPPLITPTAAQPTAQPIPPPQGASQPPQAPPQAPQGQQGPIGPEAVQALMAAASNPWLPDDQKQMARTLLASVIQRMDPAAQIEIKTKQLQLDQMEHPDKVPLTQLQQLQIDKAKADLAAMGQGEVKQVGGSLVRVKPDGTTETLYSAPDKANDFSLGPGQTRYSSDGKVIASAPTAENKAPNGYRWGPKDAEGNPTLEPIGGGPAAPLIRMIHPRPRISTPLRTTKPSLRVPAAIPL
jgi:hypothetical protein